MRAGLLAIGALLLPSVARAATLAASREHALIARADGTVWAWGTNSSGELGNGTQAPSRVPAQVPGLAGIVAVAAGSSFSAALDKAGRVYAWGANLNGQLGDATTRPRLAPAPVAGACDASGIAAADATLAALCRDGTVETWGDDENGQLGDGKSELRTGHARVHDASGAGSLQGIVAIVAGLRFFAALAKDGTVWAWGGNFIAELGQGDAGGIRPLPVHVKDASGRGVLSNITAISAALGHFTLALARDGTIWGWGANKHGQLGIGNPANPLVLPVRVKDAAAVHELGNVTAVAAGSWHSLAVRADGSLWAWGMNWKGEVGDGTNTARGRPVPVLDDKGGHFGAKLVEIAGGPYRSLALAADGTLWAWGWNAAGQLGDGTLVDRYRPTLILPSASGASAGGR